MAAGEGEEGGGMTSGSVSFLSGRPWRGSWDGAVEANVCINYVSRKSPEVLVINIFFASALSGAISARERVCVCACVCWEG